MAGKASYSRQGTVSCSLLTAISPSPLKQVSALLDNTEERMTPPGVTGGHVADMYPPVHSARPHQPCVAALCQHDKVIFISGQSIEHVSEFWISYHCLDMQAA